jgi:hypothetical protein
VRLTKAEKFYIDSKFGSLTKGEIAKDLGRTLDDKPLATYLKKQKPVEEVVQSKDSLTFKMFGNTGKGSVISNKGASEVGDDSRKKNEKKLPPYVRRI